jgi:hypothetical protein
MNSHRNGVACRVSSFTLVGFIDWLNGLRGITQDRLRSFVEASAGFEGADEANRARW